MTSLAFDMPTQADMYEHMGNKIWFRFDDHSDEWDAWVAANPNDSHIDSFSGRTISILISNAWIPGWPMYSEDTPDEYEFVTKWSGACLRDFSSGAGGFCLLETNDTELDNSYPSVSIYFDTNPDDGTTTNRV